MDKFFKYLISEFKISEELISYDLKNIKIPFYVLVKDQLTDLLEAYQLETYIVEMTPFRDSKYQQITEKTPLKVFKEEYGYTKN